MTTSQSERKASASSMPRFRDRASAGDALAASLTRFAGESGLVVIGVARGGVPVARRVAESLGAPLGVLVARRLVVPGVEDIALGAIVEGSRHVTINLAAQRFGIPARVLERIANRERVDLERCAALYHAGWPPLDLHGRVVVIVDDGLVTGGTLRAVARVARRARPARLIAAVPIASRWGLELVAREVDDIAVSYSSGMIETVASAYEDFAPVGDDDVLELLVRHTRRASVAARGDHDRVMLSPWAGDRLADRERLISVPVAGGVVRAHVGVPRRGAYESTVRRLDRVRGLALLVHADGTDLDGIAGRYLAGRLRLEGYATFRLSLTTTAEQQVGHHSRSALDVPMLATRVAEVCDWVARESIAGGHQTILIGAGVAAPAALLAAGRRPQQVRGVIVCGGDAAFVARSRSRPHAAVLVIAGADAAGVLAERAVEWLDRLDGVERNGAPRRSH